ncbi:MAG: response regulator [Lachnospiraceae bacterium]|nr:response regulator [Lachnospiraceae bacterium]
MDIRQKVLFIEGTQGFINQAIVSKLQESVFTVQRVRDEVKEIENYQEEANILIYYPSSLYNRKAFRCLLELCADQRKVLSLVGDSTIIGEARRMEDSERIYAYYQRPININQLVEDMCCLADSHIEYQRKKLVLVVDDDNDFLQVMYKWLKNSYQVDGVRSGAEAKLYLQRKRPDLILLDYVMPVQDGYQVMEQIRSNPLTGNIPIIFLTGQNDRESVMKVLNGRPDGYLLKTMDKEELLDALDRYFVERILKNGK